MENYQVEIIEKQEITNNPKILKLMFAKKSPIPGFVFFSNKPPTRIYLKTAVFSFDFFNEVYTPVANKEPNLICERRQKIFVVKESETTFQYAFNQDTIGDTLSTGLRDKSNIDKIILITKYFWRKIDDPLEEIVEQDVSVLVFNISPEKKLEVQQYLEKV